MIVWYVCEWTKRGGFYCGHAYRNTWWSRLEHSLRYGHWPKRTEK